MTKPTLVLVPGLNCTELLWQPQIEALRQSAEIIVADIAHDETMDGIARRILNNAPPKFSVAGLSMGGYVIFALQRLAPERLERIALLDTSAFADTEKVRAIRDSQIATVRAGGFEEVGNKLWPFLVHETRLDDAKLRAVVREMAAEIGPEAFIRQLLCLKERPDSRPDLHTIKVPTMIIVGDGDRLTPVAASEEMKELIPHATLEIIPGCGHLSTLEKPHAVNLLLTKWLNS